MEKPEEERKSAPQRLELAAASRFTISYTGLKQVSLQRTYAIAVVTIAETAKAHPASTRR